MCYNFFSIIFSLTLPAALGQRSDIRRSSLVIPVNRDGDNLSLSLLIHRFYRVYKNIRWNKNMRCYRWINEEVWLHLTKGNFTSQIYRPDIFVGLILFCNLSADEPALLLTSLKNNISQVRRTAGEVDRASTSPSHVSLGWLAVGHHMLPLIGSVNDTSVSWLGSRCERLSARRALGVFGCPP